MSNITLQATAQDLVHRLGNFRDEIPSEYATTDVCNELNSTISLIEGLIYEFTQP